jgi:hypothetical protein
MGVYYKTNVRAIIAWEAAGKRGAVRRLAWPTKSVDLIGERFHLDARAGEVSEPSPHLLSHRRQLANPVRGTV